MQIALTITIPTIIIILNAENYLHVLLLRCTLLKKKIKGAQLHRQKRSAELTQTSRKFDRQNFCITESSNRIKSDQNQHTYYIQTITNFPLFTFLKPQRRPIFPLVSACVWHASCRVDGCLNDHRLHNTKNCDITR